MQEFQQRETIAKNGSREREGTGVLGAFRSLTEQLIPNNPIASRGGGQNVAGDQLQFAARHRLDGGGRAGRPLKDLFEALFAAVMKLVEWILWLAPIGVFALMAWSVARIGLQTLLGPLALFVVTVLVAWRFTAA